MIRKLQLLIAIVFISVAGAFAQQEQLYTQFMYNKLGLNPAFAGNHPVIGVTGLARSQWIGFEGAPNTQTVSLNAPLADQKIGLGVNLTRNTIGISERQTIDAIYSYRIGIGEGTLSLGLQGSARRYLIDFADPRLNGITDKNLDPAVSVARFNQNVINFGAGVYYNTSHFYVGLSSPRLIERNISFASELGFSTEVRHILFMIGGGIDLNDDWTMTPQLMFRHTDNSPFDMDINLSWTWRSYLTGGLTYRHGGDSSAFAESIDVLFGFQASRELMISAAYDFTLSQIRNHASGSFEVGVHYLIGGKNSPGDNINPRYF